jgi:hypothetical protein
MAIVVHYSGPSFLVYRLYRIFCQSNRFYTNPELELGRPNHCDIYAAGTFRMRSRIEQYN